MGRKWVGPGGWDVELIRLGDREVLRARRYRFLRGYCATIAELESLLVDAGLTMADLVEVLAPRGRGR